MTRKGFDDIERCLLLILVTLSMVVLATQVLGAEAGERGGGGGGGGGGGCGYPGAPAHSIVRFTIGGVDDVLDEGEALLKETIFPFGTVAIYSCERGFELLGPARRQCQHGGSWSPEGIPFCVLNVAGGKAPMQSSSAEGGIPQRAVDGSSGQIYSPQTCTLTRKELRPWWYVNLLEPYMVQLVRLDFGKPCCGDGSPGTIIVRVGNNRPDLGTNPICNRFTGPLEEGQPLFLPCNPPMPGAFVSVHLEAASQIATRPAVEEEEEEEQEAEAAAAAAATSPAMGTSTTTTTTTVQLSLCEAFVYTDQALPIERCPQFRDQPPGSTATYNGKCYIFYNRQPMTFRDALSFCRARGGTLVDESNPALQGFISWELWRRHRSDTSSQYWMGAVRDQKDRTVWRWTGSGEQVSVSFWSLPQGSEQDCARYDGSRGWLWSDTPCSARLNYICQHQPRACGRPEQPPNSTMIITNEAMEDQAVEEVNSNYEVGASVEYSCNPGSLLIGPSTRTCLDTGFYNEFPPVCKSIECGYPASIKHGEYVLINNTVAYLSQVLYSCQDGYEMTGRARLTCDIDERWNGPPPRCEPIRCDSPSSPAHASIRIDEIEARAEPSSSSSSLINNPIKTTNRSLLVGTIVTYTCDRGYRLTGHRQILCLATGLYDHPAPTCSEETRTTVSTSPRVTVRPVSTRGRPFLPARVRTSTTSTATPPALTSVILGDTATSAPVLKSSAPSPGIGELPAVVRETMTRRPTVGLSKTHPPSSPVSTFSNVDANSDHPQDNEISGSGVDNAQAKIGTGVPEPSGPFRVDRADSPAHQAKLNLGAVIGLAVFGGFVFLAAIITTVTILIRRNRGRRSKHYRHRASPDCNTVASFDSGSSESRGGLNRYYRQAWENLHETTGTKATNHAPLRRKETLDEPGYRDNYRGGNVNERDGLSELVDNETPAYPTGKHPSVADKKRHHHHHHHHHHGNATPEWRQSQSHHRY